MVGRAPEDEAVAGSCTRQRCWLGVAMHLVPSATARSPLRSLLAAACAPPSLLVPSCAAPLVLASLGGLGQGRRRRCFLCWEGGVKHAAVCARAVRRRRRLLRWEAGDAPELPVAAFLGGGLKISSFLAMQCNFSYSLHYAMNLIEGGSTKSYLMLPGLSTRSSSASTASATSRTTRFRQYILIYM